MDVKILKLLCALLCCLYSYNVLAQSGLDKKRSELLTFIKRPAYVKVFPLVETYDDSIVCMSEDLEDLVLYKFNQYDRCIGEVMSRRCNDYNFEPNMLYFREYLRATGFVKSYSADNEYVNERDRVVAYIERNSEWLNIIFKKH